MVGDKLAKGGRNALFLPPQITQEKWDRIWEEKFKSTPHLSDKNKKENSKKESKE